MANPTKKKKITSKPNSGKPHIFEVFAKNFNAALDASGYPSLHFGRQVEVAKTFNISTSAARKWVIGDCLPEHQNLVMIADTLNISIDSLFGRTPRLDTAPMVSIPIGMPQNNDSEWLTPFSAMQLEATWIETGMRMKHNNLYLMMVNGDNMNPTLSVGDIVFIDATPIESIKSIEDNGIYLLMAQGRPQIRRVQLGLDGTVTLTSDNKHFPPVQVPMDAFSTDKNESAALQLIGKIPWAIHQVARNTPHLRPQQNVHPLR